jgi:fructose-1-phosphate kinase PfkB-like protein
MAIKKVTILEFAPTADEIWRISQNNKDGYVNYDDGNGIVSILDTAHDAKPRPDILAIYAGGKATNVARVIDKLIDNSFDTQIELVTFLPPPQEPLCDLQINRINGVDIVPSTPAGLYVQFLQITNLKNVRPHFEVVNELEETNGMQVTRRCIEIIIKDTGTSLNFSPRIVWSQKSAEAVLSRLSRIIQNTDMVVMAGAPPMWEAKQETSVTSYNFYAKILDLVSPECDVSIDVRGNYLRECLTSDRPPRFILMNKDEFFEASSLWNELDGIDFAGTLLVHDKDGCWVWDKKLPKGNEILEGSSFFPSPKVSRVHSTIGAGDTMHAGFLKAWICSDSDDWLAQSVVYSQAVSAVSVSNEEATHGINACAVNLYIQESKKNPIPL